MSAPKSPEDSRSPNFTKQGSLGSRIVRLAHSKPEFRDALQPLLYVIAAADKDKKSPGSAEDQKEFAKLLTYGPRFGIISSYNGGTEEEEQIRRAHLKGDLEAKGYRKIQLLRGKWSLLPENSFLIQNIRPDDLFDLGRKYEQEFVVFANEPMLIGFYYLEGKPRARIIVDPKGDTTFRSLTDMTPYSRARGLDVDFGLLWSQEFPWDGRTYLDRGRVRTELKNRGLQDVTP